MHSRRKRIRIAACAACCATVLLVHANTEGDPTCEAPDVKRYDGVGLKSIPRPAEPRKGRKPMAVFTARRGDESAFSRGDEGYDTYVGLSDRPFTPARGTRLRDTVIREGLKEAKRYARRLARQEYLEGTHGDPDAYVDAVTSINKLSWGSSSSRAWRFQRNALDPALADRYDSDWDDVRLVEWGPLSLSDRGALDVDTSLEGLQKFWDASLDDVELAPDPPGEAPRQLLVGRTVRFTQNFNVRVSTSKALKTFYMDDPNKWAGKILTSPRYARVAFGLDFYTAILKRKYLGTDVECRYYPSGKWVVFANIQLLGR